MENSIKEHSEKIFTIFDYNDIISRIKVEKKLIRLEFAAF